MCLLIKRILLLTILTYLKIAILLANSVHSTFIFICKTIADIFQLPTSHLLSTSPFTRNSSTQYISECSNPKVSTLIQTEDEPKRLAGCKSTTDVIIYNLNSTQKLVITQAKFKCKNCKVASKITASEKAENVAAPSIGFDGSNISYMSIESDVVDSKIESGCSSSSAISTENASINDVSEPFNSHLVYVEDSEVKTANSENNHKRVSFGNTDNTFLYSSHKLNESSDFECLKDNDPDNTSVKSDGKVMNEQKTSSPLSKLFQNPQDLCSNLTTFIADQSQITENKDADTRTNFDIRRNSEFGTDFNRRLSLPVNLNASSTAVINFKLTQKKLIEDALKNTSRHERSFKEIKYPYSSEISLDSKHTDEMNDKGVFSCSSYESLPVSDHIRNAFNNSTLLSLYNENLHSKDKPDFSCIDHLVEAFEEIKSNLSASNLALDKIIPSTVANETINVEKEKKKLGSDINLSSSVKDMCDVLDRCVTGEVKLVPDKFSKFTDKSELINCRNLRQSDGNFENNEEFGMIDCEQRRSSAKDYISFDDSLRKLEHQEEINRDESTLNGIKCTSSSSLKYRLSDEVEWTDVENELLSLKDKSDTSKSDSCDSLQKLWQQSYHKIAFIDESPPREKGHTSQNISETGCQNLRLLEEDLGAETKKFAKHSSLLPIQKRWLKRFEELAETDKNESNEMAYMTFSPNGKNSDPVYWTDVCENTELDLKNSEEINKLASFSTFYQHEIHQLQQNVLARNSQGQQYANFEENSSSGDSTSDNSVITVKDLNIAEN